MIIVIVLVKVFMDDTTIVLKEVKVMQQVIDKVNELLQWVKYK